MALNLGDVNFSYGVISDNRSFRSANDNMKKLQKGLVGIGKQSTKTNRTYKRMAVQMQRMSSTAFTSIGSRIARLGKSFISFRGILATVVGGAGLGLLIKKSLETGDTIAKVADKIGVTTDALQELRFAAEQSGVSADTLDMALQRFSRRLGEAAKGGGELKGILKEYNIDVFNAAGGTRTLTDVLGDLADTIQNASSKQEKLRIAFKAFDSEGAALVNTFSDGEAGIKRFAAEARSLGIILSEDLLRGAEGARDKLTILGKVISTQFTAAILENADAIAKLAQSFTEAIPKIVQTVRSFGEFLGLLDRTPIEKIKEIDKTLERLEEKQARGLFGPEWEIPIDILRQLGVQAGSLNLDQAIEQIEALRRTVKALVDEAKAAEPKSEFDISFPKDSSNKQLQAIAGHTFKPAGLDQVIQELEQYFNVTTKAVAAQQSLSDKFAEGRAVIEANVTTFERYQNSLNNLVDLQSVGAINTDQLAEAQDRLKNAMRLDAGIIDPLREYNTELERLHQLLNANVISQGEFGRAAEGLQDDFIAANKGLRAMEAGLQRIGETTVLAMLQGGNAMEAFKQTAFNVISEILAKWITAEITKFLMSLALQAGGVPRSVAGPAAALAGPTTPGPAPTTFTGPRAHGGPVAAGGSFLVGEQGPELFMPGRSGTIIPNDKMGGNTTNIIFDFRGTQGDEQIQKMVFKGINQAAPALIGASINAVRDERSHNPNFFGGQGL